MSAMGTTPTTGPASGRPRDPGLEARVLDAAFSVYARRGWAGFTSEEVARQAGVGKSSLYLRWPTKLAVLLDSIRLRERDNVVADTGDLRHDLLAFARQTFDRLNGEDGAVTLRLIVESRFYDDLRDGLSSAAHIEQIHAIRAIVRRDQTRRPRISKGWLSARGAHRSEDVMCGAPRQRSGHPRGRQLRLSGPY